MQKTPNTPTKTASTPTKTASTPTKTASTPNINVRCFVAMRFLSQIYALFWHTIYRPKCAVAYKKDKYEVCQNPTSNLQLFLTECMDQLPHMLWLCSTPLVNSRQCYMQTVWNPQSTLGINVDLKEQREFLAAQSDALRKQSFRDGPIPSH